MEIIYQLDQLKSLIKGQKEKGKTIGFVPTMGFLHEGHLSLMQEARSQSDCVVVSIFVNPTQFGPNEDFEAYPRDLERDIKACETMGVDYVFIPSVETIYPDGFSTYAICEGEITQKLCGKSRPTHFKGVTTVVLKLFNMVEADFAFFGQKDAQQVAVIEKMVSDLNLNVRIIPCPIVREADGLAMSSRNVYLNPEERAQALVLYQSLKRVESLIQSGEKNVKILKSEIQSCIEKSPLAEIDYIEVVKASNLETPEELSGDILIALAVKFGKTRLIDNIRLQA